MKYKGEALGLVETKGMVPAIDAADIMCKSADVELVSYENVGSGLVTVLVAGDVAAVTAAVDAGAKAASAIGELTGKNVMPRPIGNIKHIVDAHDIDQE